MVSISRYFVPRASAQAVAQVVPGFGGAYVPQKYETALFKPLNY